MKEEKSDQFSLENVLISFIGFIPFVKRNKRIILIFTAVGLITGLGVEIYKSSNNFKKTKIVFVLESESADNGLAGLASSLGLGGMSSGNSIFSGENFKELLKTKNIYRKAILTKVKVGNRTDFFGNFFLERSDLENHEWSNLPVDFVKYRFKTGNIDSIDVQDKNIINAISMYLNDNTDIFLDNPKSTFQTLTVETRNDTITHVWAQLYLKTITDYYINTKTKKSKELLVIMDKRVDSLRSALYYTQGKLANYNDQNQQIIFQRARVIAERLQMNSTQLQSLYFEALRNYDNLKFSLVKEAPLLTIIEDSELPIITLPYKWGKIIVIGTLLGFILGCFAAYVRFLYKVNFN
ncbi:MAG: hypothetical protein KA527_00630 [Cytophagaceae bacterium]|jgi:hypothetical protein|nr:hypothetical protein [Cytophagaceae bacterium]MBP6093002.1 hypothetical protein [Cytophagaceae bacterium]